MIDLSMTVKKNRIVIDYDEKLQDFIKDILVISGEEKSNRAYYTIGFHRANKIKA